MPDEGLARLRRLWAGTDGFGFTLLTHFVDHFWREFPDEKSPDRRSPLEWTPATIEMELAADLQVEPSATAMDRLQTAIAVLTGDSFFVSPVDFARGCVSLAGPFVPADHMAMPDCKDIAWGITEALLIRPPEDDEREMFSPEVIGLIGQALDAEGIINPPDVLRIGARDTDWSARVSYDFSDDPEMFAAVQQVEASRTDEINATVRGGLRRMLEQLRDLPLRYGKTEPVAALLARLPVA